MGLMRPCLYFFIHSNISKNQTRELQTNRRAVGKAARGAHEKGEEVPYAPSSETIKYHANQSPPKVRCFSEDFHNPHAATRCKWPNVPNTVLHVFRNAPADLITKELPDIMNLLTNMQNATLIHHMLAKVPNIAEQAIESSERVPALKDVVGDCLLPLVLRNLGNSEASLGKKAERALIEMIEKGLITKVQAEIKICPEILALTTISQEGCNTEVNIGVTTKIMSKLAHLLGKDITERILLPRFIELCSSHIFYIRKFATSNFGYYCAVIGKEAFEGKLLPLYLSLCQDETWGVRKSCASVITYVSCACPADLRKALLAESFAKLLVDDCRWVSMAAFESLGTFIVTFADPPLIHMGYDASGELVLLNHQGNNFYDARVDGFDNWQSGVLGFQDERLLVSSGMFGPEFDFDGNQVTDLDDVTFCQTMEYFSNGKGKNGTTTPKEPPVETKHEDDLLSYNEFNYWHISPPETIDLEGFVVDLPPNAADQGTASLQDQDATDLNKSSASAPGDNISDLVNKLSDVSINEDAAPSMAAIEEEEEENVEPPQKIVPQHLLDSFVSITDPEKFSDGEMLQNCAYVLPAVAVTLGKDNWPLLKGTTERLAMHMSYKIRKTVASSLHELAQILGPELAASHLSPLFEGFLKDVDEVRIAILNHLHEFLSLIGPDHRVVFLPKLADFLRVENLCNWRFQETFAEQLTECVPLFAPKDVVKHIGAYAQSLLLHNVAAVRRSAILLITRIVKHIIKDDMLLSNYILMMCQRFALSKKWRARQSFAMFCAEVLEQRVMEVDRFVALLLHQLLDLSWDPVANVRMIVGDCITKHLVVNDAEPILPAESLEWLNPVLRKLQADTDGDVRYYASHH